MKRLPLDDLPKHSEWAAYLLDPAGEPPGEPDAYTRAETYAAIYDRILEAYRSDPAPTPAFVRSTRSKGQSEPDVISIEEELYLASTAELLERERLVVREALEPIVPEAEAVVDLGFGWGHTLGTIADAFPDLDVVGGEFVESGVQVARELYADRERVSVEQFDFHGDWDLLAELDRECVVFTKESLTTVSAVEPIVDRFARLARDGDVVGGVHVEQVDLHPETVLGGLRRHYARFRGYNGELPRVLERDDRLAVVDVSYDVFGSNPLHPVSVIRWRPA